MKRRISAWNIILPVCLACLTGCDAMEELFYPSNFEVQSCAPGENQKGVSPDASVEIAFNEDVDRASVESNFTLTGSSGSVEGEFLWITSRIVRFVPRYQLKRTERYLIQINGDARSDTGKRMIISFLSDFYVGNDFDAPGVVSSNPVALTGGATIPDDAVAGFNTITVTFSEPMNREKTESAFSLSPSLGGYFTWDAADQEMTYHLTDELEQGKRYALTVTAGAEDAGGNPLARDFTMAFFAGQDVTPPEVDGIKSAWIDPYWNSAGLTSIDRNIKSIYVVFSEDMAKSGTDTSFTISPSVSGHIGWLNASTMVFTLEEQLESEQVYQVTVSTEAKDSHGLRLAATCRYNVITDLPDSKHVTVGRVWGSKTGLAGDFTLLFDKNPAMWPVPATIQANADKDKDGGYYYYKIQFLRDEVPVSMKKTSLPDNYLLDDIDGGTPSPVLASASWVAEDGVSDSAVVLKMDRLKMATPPVLFRFTLMGGASGLVDTADNTMIDNFFFDFREE